MNIFLKPFLFLCLTLSVQVSAQTVVNGIPWYDQNREPVSGHGANIIKDGGRYYLFGEYKTDSANVFTGFSCYSSSDLAQWQFEGMAFSQQQDGRMGPGRVGDTFIYKYKGTQIGIYGNTDSESGYADISIKDKAGNVVFQTSIDFYSLKPAKVIKKI